MVSVQRVRALALALPEATEQDHHGRPSFRVGRISGDDLRTSAIST